MAIDMDAVVATEMVAHRLAIAKTQMIAVAENRIDTKKMKEIDLFF
jgi:hypothetical protein